MKTKKAKPVDFQKAMKDIKKALLATHEIRQTKESYDYKGEEITHTSVLVIDHNVKESLKALYVKKSKEQGRDMLDIILSKVFQLGYSAAKFLIDIGRAHLEGFSEKLKNSKENQK